MPCGAKIYTGLQKRLGTLDEDPGFRLPHLASMLRMLTEIGFTPQGKTFLEVGTGHRFIVPAGLFLAGAERVYTMDLHTRLDEAICAGNLRRMAEDAHTYWERLFQHLIPRELWNGRMAVLRELADRPKDFMRVAGIKYLAPADAARTGLGEGSVDCHFSVTTLEHIPPAALTDIMLEASGSCPLMGSVCI